MARRATSLGPKPSLFLFCFFFFFCLVFCFGGFKGQVRWPRGPPHLALNPPYLFFWVFFLVCCCSFSFLCFVIQKKPCFPPRKGHFLFIFECLPLFLLSFFGPPLFQFLFLCLSLLLVLFPFLSCLSFLLSFASLFCLFLSFSFFFCFCFMKRTTSEYSITNFPLHQYFLFFGFLSSFLFEISFSYLCFLADFKLCFCSTSLFLVSKNTS